MALTITKIELLTLDPISVTTRMVALLNQISFSHSAIVRDVLGHVGDGRAIG